MVLRRKETGAGAAKKSEFWATRTAVGEARTARATVLTLHGVVMASGAKTRGASVNSGAKPDADRVARSIAYHPGSRAEDIATALETGTADRETQPS